MSSRSRTVASEREKKLLQRKDLAAVAQRTLGQQPDLREAVDHHPMGLHPLEGFEDKLCGLPELQVGGVQEALLLVGIKKAFRGNELKNLDLIADVLPMGEGTVAQFLLGFRKRNVETALANAGASSRNCNATVVFPEPGAPSSRKEWRRESPPDRMSSRPPPRSSLLHLNCLSSPWRPMK